MKQDRIKILICLVAIVGMVYAYLWYEAEQIKDNLIIEVTQTAEDFGLEDVFVLVGEEVPELKKYNYYYVTISSSNFQKFSNDEKFAFDEAIGLIPNCFMDMYMVDTGYYEVYSSSRSIYKNGKEIYSDYEPKENKISNPFGTAVTDSDLKIDAWVCAKDIVEKDLKVPSSADFCSLSEATVFSNGGSDYTVVGYVDAENSLGVEIRSDFVVTLTLTKNGYVDGVSTFI